MSTVGHLLKRAKHYLDPRTQIKATVHLAERTAYYANPATHIQAAQRAAHFVNRESRKEYIKFNRINSFIAPVLTPIVAFVASFIPVFGLILGPVVAFIGAAIARVSTGVALRSQGVTGLENSQKSRAKQNRTLKYGLAGSAVGGIASALGLGVAAGVEAGAEVGASEAASAAPSIAANGSPIVTSVSLEGAGADILPTVAGNTAQLGLTAGATSAELGSGILGTGITWGQVGTVLQSTISIVPSVLKQLGIGVPKPAPQSGGVQLVGGAGDAGGGGAEGTGNVGAEGPLGPLLDGLSGLPLPIKIGAALLGLGGVALAFKGNK